MKINFAALTDEEVIASLKLLVGDERRTVAAVLRHLNEFDRRRLAAGTRSRHSSSTPRPPGGEPCGTA